MEPKRTSLYEIHRQLGAKMVEFAGYLMPVQYRGIRAEHLKVRESVGIFDVSHMGEFSITGENAGSYLQSITLNDVTKLVPGRAQYSGMCYEDGGMVDDFIVYRFPDHYMVIVNASNLDKDYEWMKKHLLPGVELTDRSDDYTLLAVQGRNAEATLQKLTATDLAAIKTYRFCSGKLAEADVTFFRTGYTGEDGFEIGLDVRHSTVVWNAIMDAGKEFGIEPIGLAARDTLRMEMKFCLYGNDIDETTNPIEAGLGWVTKIDKGKFVGRSALKQVKETGPSRKFVGFEMKQRAVPRQGYKIFKESQEVGRVTSGTFSPSLEKGIGLGYVKVPFNEVGTDFAISIRDKEVPAQVVKTPFYERPY